MESYANQEEILIVADLSEYVETADPPQVQKCNDKYAHWETDCRTESN